MIPRIQVFAHGGMSLYEERAIYPANSFEAIEYSIDVLGANGIEIDVQMTKDCVLVLFHDAFITTSPNFSGCIGNYNWNIIKSLTYNNTSCTIVKLDSVLDYLVRKNVNVYLDLKPYNFCSQSVSNLNVFASKVDLIMANYLVEEKQLVIAGSVDKHLLKKVNTLYKCFEAINVDDVLLVAEEESFQYVLLPFHLINEKVALQLLNSPFKWGVFGGKSNGEIRKTVSFKPDCFISDNFVYTQKITK